MHRERVWFGTALMALPVLLLFPIFSPPVGVRRSGPIEGFVSVHGRPLTGGFILFVPDDAKSNPVVGSIDAKGHYTIQDNWARDGSRDGDHYRICLIPSPRETSEAEQEDSSPAAADQASADVSHLAVSPALNVVSRFPRRLSDPRTSRLEVRLNSGPAKVDIDL